MAGFSTIFPQQFKRARILIGQIQAISVLALDNMEFEEAASMSFNEPQIGADISLGNTTFGEKKPVPSKPLDIEPLQLHFPSVLGKITVCSLNLTNKTDAQVAFRLMEKSGMNWSGFLNLPLCRFMQPRSTYALVVKIRTQELKEPPQERYMDVILQSSALEYQNIYPLVKDSEYDQFFSDAKEAGKAVHEVTIKAVYGDEQGKTTSEGITNGIKILSAEETPGILRSIDVNQTNPWVVTVDGKGHVRILQSDTQRLVDSMEDKMEGEASCVKFIERKKWVLAGSDYGSIYVYNYANIMEKVERINAATGRITSLAVHPTLPLVLSTAVQGPIKLWNWDRQWECTKEFDDEHSDLISLVMFNPVDTNSFASASWDHTVKVWSLDTPTSGCTLKGHSDEVTCLDYFTCDSKQYLITGSRDHTAKIWDMETEMCVQTLHTSMFDVTSVRSHPSLPLLITGSDDGIVSFWSSTTFRLENVLETGRGNWYNPVVGLGCFKDSRRIVIAQENRLSVIEFVDGEPEASKDRDDDEEPAASKDQDDHEVLQLAKTKHDDEEPVPSKAQDEQNI